MRVVLQRVNHAKVTVDGEVVGQIGAGFVALVGVGNGDRREDAEALASKIATLRAFAADDGRFDRSLLDDPDRKVLVVSQFTLLADVRKGRRPSFSAAAPPEVAEPLVEHFADALRDQGVAVESGRFGAMMDVELVNAGPVTIVLDASAGRVL